MLTTCYYSMFDTSLQLVYFAVLSSTCVKKHFTQRLSYESRVGLFHQFAGFLLLELFCHSLEFQFLFSQLS